MSDKINFEEKLRKLKNKNGMIKNNGKVKLLIRRNHLFEDAYKAIMNKTPYELKKNLYIKYLNEKGSDSGGLKRDFFFQISKEIVNNSYDLFKYSNENSYRLKINNSLILKYQEPKILNYYKFIGRIIGMAIFHSQYLAVSFTIPLYKELLNINLDCEDLKDIDPQIYHNLLWLRNNHVTKDQGLTFTKTIRSNGITKTIDLKPFGAYIQVTDANKSEYIDLMIDYYIHNGTKKQITALKEGFNQIISKSLLNDFNVQDLELLTCGTKNIDINDWKNYTDYKGYNKYDTTIVNFWNCVYEYDNEMRSKLLQFTTGNPQLPVTGFKDLQGDNGPHHFTICNTGSVSRLPQSHTCFNSIDLPPYRTYSQLKEKLTLAVIEGCESFELL